MKQVLGADFILQQVIKVEQHLIIIFKLVCLYAYRVAIIQHPNDQRATMGIKEGRHGLEYPQLHTGIFIAGMQVGTQGACEFSGGVFTLVDQIRY